MIDAKYLQAIDFLYGRINYERTAMPYQSPNLRLDRMRQLLQRLGNPHHGMGCVHIAGTKGKGSTAAMVASILGRTTLRTGLYTSPHLNSLQERIQVNSNPISQDSLAELAVELRNEVQVLDHAGTEDLSPTFFEILTALAFLYFHRMGVEIAVMEVGLGGRLDSTNVCEPLVSAITSISLDHVAQLGHTLSLIAREKAGIIKPDVPVVSGVLAAEARLEIEAIAKDRKSPLIQFERDFWVEPVNVIDGNVRTSTSSRSRFSYGETINGHTSLIENLQIGLLGPHQVANASVACAIISQLRMRGVQISESMLRQGLLDARCPARVEVVGEHPTVVLDVAHNPASIEALLRTLQDRDFHRRILIFAASSDKDVRGMLQALYPAFDVIVLTRFTENPRAIPPESAISLLAELTESTGPGRPIIEITQSPAEAWQVAVSHVTPSDLICITGSFFLAAEIGPLLVRESISPKSPSKG